MSDSKISVEYVGSLSGHNGFVTSLAVGEDSNKKPLLISGSRDRSLIVWSLNLDNPEEITIGEGEEQEKDYKVGKPYKALKGHSHFVSSIAISRDSKYVISGSWDKTLRLWDLTTMSTKQLFTGHTKDVLSVAFSNDNRMILSGSMDKTMRLWNAKGEMKFEYTKFDGWVSAITHIRQGDKDSMIAVGSWDSKVRLLDSELNLIRNIDALDYGVVSIKSDDEGEFLFVGQKNGTINIWNIGVDKESDSLKQTIDVQADLYDLSYISKYYNVISLATSKGLVIREIKGNSEGVVKNFGKNNPCLSLAWDPSRTYLFAGFADGVIRLYKYTQ